MSGQMESVRRNYGVPAFRGKEIVFRGTPPPITGRIISSTGSHLYIRTNDGRRFGPLHPTWAIDYGDGRDYTAECNAIIEIRNLWLNGKIDTAECRARCRAVREHGA